MSKEILVSKDDIKRLLECLGKERKLVAPVDTGRVIEFREVFTSGIQDSIKILAKNTVSYKSLKEFYFPQAELMFTFTKDDIIDNISLPGYVIFGARPCDLEALRIMSVVYTTGKYNDPFFKRHFETNLIIGIGCTGEKPGCFCKEMEIDREYSNFCDIMLIDAGNDYSVVHLSEKGENALKEVPEVYARYINSSGGLPASKTEEPSPCSASSGLMLDSSKKDSDYFDVIDWEKVTKACKGCGICTYICPTCYCFDFRDIMEKGEAKRYKCWDSCMYPKFTLHASGHNPREFRHERYRQRILHKYKYVPDNFNGYVACTGCGRCIRSCPAGINIKDIVTLIISQMEN